MAGPEGYMSEKKKEKERGKKRERRKERNLRKCFISPVLSGSNSHLHIAAFYFIQTNELSFTRKKFSLVVGSSSILMKIRSHMTTKKKQV